ncbi:MAG: glycerophosphodiester phosphodiesterase family protein [Azospirillaceae bacterium]
MLRRLLLMVAAVLGAFIVFAVANNANWLRAAREAEPVLLAHRGMAQDFERAGLTGETCTAARMLPPVHGFLENTLPSIAAAADAGADIVEIDVQPTADGAFVLFHDWTLDCRTEASGVTRERTLADLRALDIGHGYTADDGASFPFRRQGRGLMPTLEEALATFPDLPFVINVKSDDPAEGVLLAGLLAELPAARRDSLMVLGGARPVAEIEARLPGLVTGSRETIRACLVDYMIQGWTGIVPSSCQGRLLLVPVDDADWLWGWPDLFLDRMDRVGARVFVVAPLEGAFTRGLNDTDDLALLPEGYTGGLSTDRIDVVGPALGR